MSLIGMIIALALIGVIWYVVETYVPMAKPIKTIIRIVIIIVIILWLLQSFGLLGSVSNIRIK